MIERVCLAQLTVEQPKTTVEKYFIVKQNCFWKIVVRMMQEVA